MMPCRSTAPHYFWMAACLGGSARNVLCSHGFVSGSISIECWMVLFWSSRPLHIEQYLCSIRRTSLCHLTCKCLKSRFLSFPPCTVWEQPTVRPKILGVAGIFDRSRFWNIIDYCKGILNAKSASHKSLKMCQARRNHLISKPCVGSKIIINQKPKRFVWLDLSNFIDADQFMLLKQVWFRLNNH